MARPKIVLYNPRAPFYTMPLALLAIAAAVDRRRYDVIVIDGRVEREPIAAVLAATDGALCLAVSVLTGVPIRDAVAVTNAVRAARPSCRIVWGGWHASLFPLDTLRESGADAVVVGQGEDTFAEMVERWAARESLRGVPGCVGREPRDTAAEEIFINPPRVTRDINAFPAHAYDLIDPDRYFQLKGQRQLDYITSQGCRFRCTFCADPTVYGRAWFGLSPDRVVDELAGLWERYQFTDVGFQDETFFTSASRVAAIADGVLSRSLAFSWMATMRADQGARLDEQVLRDCRRAGLRRVMIGLESGSQEMLDWMKKDIRLDQVFDTAAKCARHRVAVLFNLIVGFPDEPETSIAATLAAAKRLRALGPDFQVALFYYRPYPGTPITDALARRGHRLPRTLPEWAAIEDDAAGGLWIAPELRARIDRFNFYQRIGWSRRGLWRAPVQMLARWRCRGDHYAFPVEKAIVERLRPTVTR